MTKHDFENSLVTIKTLSSSIEPVIEAMVDYIVDNEAFHIASRKQLDIVTKTMQGIISESSALQSMSKVIDFPEEKK